MDELETALTLLIHRDRPLLMAQIRLELAHALANAGENASAMVEAEAALATFHKLGVVPDVSAGQAMLDDLAAIGMAAAAPGELTGAPRQAGAGVESLTQREAEVARLVAAGQTNREVAAGLFPSVRTVRLTSTVSLASSTSTPAPSSPPGQSRGAGRNYVVRLRSPADSGFLSGPLPSQSGRRPPAGLEELAWQ